MSFAARLQYGKAAESAIAKWLMRKGHSVLPIYEKIIDEGKGPQLFTGGEGLIAPDLLSIRPQKIMWIEAKHKNAFTWYRNAYPHPRFETGIDQRHYDDYQLVADITHLPIWLLFLHEGGIAKDSPPSPSGLYGADIAVLKANESHRSDRWGRSGMVYWARDVDGGPLRFIASLQEVLGL